MPKSKAYYRVVDIDDDDERTECETSWDIERNPGYVAEDCAEDYHANREGWEDEWPLLFEVFKQEQEGGCSFGQFRVYRDFDPTFRGYKVEEKEAEH